MSSEYTIELIGEILGWLSSESTEIMALKTITDSLNIDLEEDYKKFLLEFTPEEIVVELYDKAKENLNDEAIIAALQSNEDLKNYIEEKLREFARRQITVEILVEEPSMQNLLHIVLPNILPAGYELGVNCFVRPHQGKSDLQKSIPTKVTAYQHFPQTVRLIVIQDQDSNDCMVLKQSLIDLITDKNSSQPYLVRIACKELENWYLGDMQAIEAVYPSFRAQTHQRKAKYRNIDNIFGADDLQRQIKGFAKGFASKNIPKEMNLQENNSPSFNHFLTGVQKFLD